MRQIGSFAVDATAGEKMRKHLQICARISKGLAANPPQWSYRDSLLYATGEVMGPVAIDSKLTWGERALLTALHVTGQDSSF